MLVSAVLNLGFGQDKIARKYLEYADTSFEEGNYATASFYYEAYQNAYDDWYSHRCEIWPKMGKAYYETGQLKKAETVWQEVFSACEEPQFDNQTWWYIDGLKQLGSYNDAIAVLQTLSPTNQVQLKFKSDQLRDCQRVQSEQPDTLIHLIHLPEKVNTAAGELSPQWLSDTTLLFYRNEFESADGKNEQGVWITHATDTTWRRVAITPLKDANDIDWVNRSQLSNENYVGSLKTDQETIELKALKTDSIQWTELNSQGWNTTQPYLYQRRDTTWILFASDNPTGKGGMDIYRSYLIGSRWTEPENLWFNTPEDDVTPSYESSTESIYFSTRHHSKYGGFDIYKVTGRKVQALPKPINSSANDFYYTPRNENTVAFTSDRSSDNADIRSCCTDIYIAQKTTPAHKVEPTPIDTFIFKPVVLYFHNDRPDEDSWDTLTTMSYDQWYERYHTLKTTYLSENANTGNTAEATESVEKIIAFWDQSLTKGWSDLQAFDQQLALKLKAGKRLQLVVKGYASPLAKTDYNVNLTLRRIHSLELYYRLNKSKMPLAKYFSPDSTGLAQLEIVRAPMGEYQADQNISDDVENERESIYSAGAALERRIEIIELRELGQQQGPQLTTTKATKSFGKVPNNAPLTHHFELFNQGNKTAEIDSVVVGCHCTEATLSQDAIAPGSKTTLSTLWNGAGRNGFHQMKIEVYYDHRSIPLELYLNAEFED